MGCCCDRHAMPVVDDRAAAALQDDPVRSPVPIDFVFREPSQVRESRTRSRANNNMIGGGGAGGKKSLAGGVSAGGGAKLATNGEGAGAGEMGAITTFTPRDLVEVESFDGSLNSTLNVPNTMTTNGHADVDQTLVGSFIASVQGDFDPLSMLEGSFTGSVASRRYGSMISRHDNHTNVQQQPVLSQQYRAYIAAGKTDSERLQRLIEVEEMTRAEIYSKMVVTTKMLALAAKKLVPTIRQRRLPQSDSKRMPQAPHTSAINSQRGAVKNSSFSESRRPLSRQHTGASASATSASSVPQLRTSNTSNKLASNGQQQQQQQQSSQYQSVAQGANGSSSSQTKTSKRKKDPHRTSPNQPFPDENQPYRHPVLVIHSRDIQLDFEEPADQPLLNDTTNNNNAASASHGGALPYAGASQASNQTMMTAMSTYNAQHAAALNNQMSTGDFTPSLYQVPSHGAMQREHSAIMTNSHNYFSPPEEVMQRPLLPDASAGGAVAGAGRGGAAQRTSTAQHLSGTGSLKARGGAATSSAAHHDEVNLDEEEREVVEHYEILMLSAVEVDLNSKVKGEIIHHTWDFLSVPHAQQHLNSGHAYFRFVSGALPGLQEPDHEVIDTFINLTAFQDEEKENGCPHINVFDKTDQAKYVGILVKAMYMLPGAKIANITRELISSLDYQRNCQPGDVKFEDGITTPFTFRQTKTIIKFVYSVCIQMVVSEITDPEKLVKLKDYDGMVPAKAVLLERTKRNIKKADSTAKCKSVLLYYAVNGGVLVSHQTIVMNTSVPTIAAKLLHQFGGQGCSEAAETCMMTRKYLVNRFGDSRQMSY